MCWNICCSWTRISASCPRLDGRCLANCILCAASLRSTCGAIWVGLPLRRAQGVPSSPTHVLDSSSPDLSGLLGIVHARLSRGTLRYERLERSLTHPPAQRLSCWGFPPAPPPKARCTFGNPTMSPIFIAMTFPGSSRPCPRHLKGNAHRAILVGLPPRWFVLGPSATLHERRTVRCADGGGCWIVPGVGCGLHWLCGPSRWAICPRATSHQARVGLGRFQTCSRELSRKA